MANSSLAQANRDAIRRRGEIESDSKLSDSRLKQDFRFTRSALDRQLKSSIGESADQFAGQGLYNSGIRQEDQSEIATDYATNTGLASQSLQRELENLNRSKTKGLLGISSGLESTLIGSTGESLAAIIARAMNDAKSRYR